MSEEIKSLEQEIGNGPVVANGDNAVKEQIPMKLSWKDISYSVKVKYTKKEKKEMGITDSTYDKVLLKEQSGYIKSGETTFIMGSSGAGKTTLLNALCDRITKSRTAKLTGEIMINDTYPVSQNDFGKYGAYVMQDDVLFQTLTCEEAISFAAQLKIGLKGEELKEKVHSILECLGLLKCRNTLIGSQHIKGLSGGERKRTAIGVELITDPSILFLDEPTSGLDSFTSHKIVKLLVSQSRLGKTVIATIHQPSSSTFALFDRLILLMDGYVIYQGPAKEAADYFTKIGFLCPKYANPADFFLKEFYVPFKKTSADEEKLKKLVSSYDEKMKGTIAKENEECKFEPVSEDSIKKSVSSVSIFKELWLLTIRSAKNLKRNPQASRVRLMQTLIMAILVILVFWDMGTNTDGINGKSGYAFFVSINQVMTALFSVLLTFLMERPVFLREYASKMYGIWSYFTSKSITELPFQSIMPFLFALITYFAIGLTADADRFFIFSLILILDVFCATSFGFFIGCAVTNSSAATALTSLLMLPFILFGGYFVNLDDVYVWLRWLQYLSPIRYSTEAILRNEFENNSKYGSAITYEKYHYNIGMWYCILILGALGVFFRFFALFFLRLTVAKVQ